ncbi:MAG: type II toxin-antitoxin system HicB family antitoxin [Clostridiales bacterium]|nr:type II toxin-antitoxin system HicB family antitoxin [Clostridiales bacterium]
MAKYTYPAVFTPETNGGYSVSFPDIEGCYTCGDNLGESIEMAEDALALMMYEYEKEHRPIPQPSTRNSIIPEGDGFINYIACDTLTYRKMYNNQAVKKTLTIPEWLNEAAMEKGINFSQTLQEALMAKIL